MQIIPLANRGERAKAPPPVITNSRDYPISLGQEAANTGSPARSRVVKSREKSRPVTIRRPLSKIDWIEYRSLMGLNHRLILHDFPLERAPKARGF